MTRVNVLEVTGRMLHWEKSHDPLNIKNNITVEFLKYKLVFY